MIHYVLGFMFSEDRANVLSIKKNKPYWQKGKLNGIGGKIDIESGETNRQAMVREFKEETGISSLQADWKLFAFIENRNKGGMVFCYKAFDNAMFNFKQIESEIPIIVEVNTIQERVAIISNLKFLIPLALYGEDNLGITNFNYS